MLGEDGRVDAASELAQLVEGGAQLAVGLGEELGGAVRVGAELRAGELERQPEREQPLLGAVVEVALEPPSLLVAGADDPFAGGAQLGQLCAQLGLQPFVFEREPGGRTGRLRAAPRRSSRTGSWTSAATGASAGPSTVTARSASGAGSSNGRPDASTYDRRSGSQSASSSVGSPSVRASASRTDARRRVLELDDQVGDARAGAAAPEQAGGKRHRDGELGGGHDPEPDRVP